MKNYFAALVSQRPWARLVVIYASLVFVTLCAYLPTFWAPFVFDDAPMIVKFLGRGGDPFALVWAHSRWFAYAFNLFIGNHFGPNLLVFRSVALGIHFLIGLMLFLLVKRVAAHYPQETFFHRKGFGVAVAATAFYLLHPAQAQTVGYITQMELEGFALLSIVATLYGVTVHATTSSRYIKYLSAFLVWVLILFAAGTKEIIVILPALFFLFDWFFLSQGSFSALKSRMLLYGVLIGSLFAVMYKQGGVTVPVAQALSAKIELPSNRGNQLVENRGKITSYRYCITQWRVLMHYIRIYVCPYPLSFDYSFTLARSIFEPAVLISLCALLALFSLSIVLFIRNPLNLFSFSLWWFFIAVAPRSTIIPSWELAADYKAFIASFGFMIFLGYGVVYMYETFRFVESIKKSMQGLAVAVVLLFSFRVFEESLIRTDLTEYWRNALWHAPKKARLWNNYAVCLSETMRTGEAVAAYETAIALDDRYAEPLVNLGLHYHALGDKKKAWEFYKKALVITEEPHPVLYSNVAGLYLEEKKYKEAEEAIKIALYLKYDYAEAYGNLGFVYADTHREEEAITMFLKALTFGCSHQSVKFRCGELLLARGREEEAVALLAPGKRVDNAFFASLGQQLYQMKQYERAVVYYAYALRKEPENALLRYNIGLCYLALNRWEQASGEFKEVLYERSLPFAPIHYVKALAAGGKKREAEERAHKLLSASDFAPHLKNELVALSKEFKLNL